MSRKDLSVYPPSPHLLKFVNLDNKSERTICTIMRVRMLKPELSKGQINYHPGKKQNANIKMYIYLIVIYKYSNYFGMQSKIMTSLIPCHLLPSPYAAFL